MSLMKNNLTKVILNQYIYKIRGNSNIIISLILVQLTAMILTLLGIGKSNINSGELNVIFFRDSNALIVVFTIVWTFVISIIINLSSKKHIEIDFIFVSNRISSKISSYIFLITLCLAGAVTTPLYNIVLRVIRYFTTGDWILSGENFILEPKTILLSMVSTFLYLTIIASLAYFIGTLMQVNGFFSIIVPTLFLGAAIESFMPGSVIKLKFVNYFILEESILVFGLKAIIFSIFMCAVSILMVNWKEVRK